MRLVRQGNCEVLHQKTVPITSEDVARFRPDSKHVCHSCRTIFEIQLGDNVIERKEVMKGDVEIQKLAFYASCPGCDLLVYLFEKEISSVKLSMPRAAAFAETVPMEPMPLAA